MQALASLIFIVKNCYFIFTLFYKNINQCYVMTLDFYTFSGFRVEYECLESKRFLVLYLPYIVSLCIICSGL